MLRRPKWRLAAVALTTAAAVLIAVVALAMAAGPAPGQRIDMKVLLLAATGNEPAYDAWKAALDREGVPYDAKIADQEGPFTDATFADYGANRAKYQAVILANGDLLHQEGTQFVTALSPAEWDALEKFERTFGIRQISDSTFPTPDHGMNVPAAAGSDQGGNTGQLTDAGKGIFQELQGPVPIDAGSFGFQSTPATSAFQTLMTGPNNSSYMGIHTHADGREELVFTVDANQFQTHDNLLRHGMLVWATRGVYLGYQRHYFEMHVDDVFLPDDRWDANLDRTLVDAPTSAPDEVTCDPDATNPSVPDCRPIRMTAADVDRALQWQSANGLVLDMVFNGMGSDEAGAGDPLTQRLQQTKSSFRWINHTWSHPNLDAAPVTLLLFEIDQNITWGRQQNLSFDAAELVTGEHSGLHNPAMPGVLAQTGIRWVASDNSREPTPYQVGPATTVPRYPSNVYYNVGTQAEQLDEYNHIYLPPPSGRCVNTATNTCRASPATWAEYVGSEASIMFRHLLINDPRPHYAHQSNLAEEGVLYSVLDTVIGRYRTHFKPPLIQLTQSQIGETIHRQTTWRAHRDAGRVSAYLLDGQVHIETAETMDVPVTGTSVGDEYGGVRSGWTTVAPNNPAVVNAAVQGASQRPQGTRPPSGAGPLGQARPAPNGTTRRLAIRRLTMSPRRFAVAHRSWRKRVRQPDGTRISWRLSAAPATMRFTVQRRVVVTRKVAGKGGKRVSRKVVRYRRLGSFTRRSTRTTGVVRFKGRISRRLLKPGRYRLVAAATARNGQRSRSKSLTFTVKRG